MHLLVSPPIQPTDVPYTPGYNGPYAFVMLILVGALFVVCLVGWAVETWRKYSVFGGLLIAAIIVLLFLQMSGNLKTTTPSVVTPVPSVPPR